MNGTKIRAYRSARRTNGALLCCASLTRRTIPAYALSAAVADGAEIERGPGVDGSRGDLVAFLAGHQPGLAGERGFVEDGRAPDDHAVDRHHFAGADRQQVAGDDGLDRGRLEPAIRDSAGRPAVPVRGARSARGARDPAHSAPSASPVASMTAMTPAANGSPSGSAPTIARIAMRSTPSSPCTRSRTIAHASRIATTTAGIVQTTSAASCCRPTSTPAPRRARPRSWAGSRGRRDGAPGRSGSSVDRCAARAAVPGGMTLTDRVIAGGSPRAPGRSAPSRGPSGLCGRRGP